MLRDGPIGGGGGSTPAGSARDSSFSRFNSFSASASTGAGFGRAGGGAATSGTSVISEVDDAIGRLATSVPFDRRNDEGATTHMTRIAQTNPRHKPVANCL